MRLIDADKITFFNCLAKTGNAVCCHAEGIVSKSAIEMQSTVKAIPVEWLKTQIEKCQEISNTSKTVGLAILAETIKQWEKEHE